jgi:hypothetical protein
VDGSVSLFDQAAEAVLSRFAGRDVMPVKKRCKARNLYEIAAVPSRIRDEYLELVAGDRFSHAKAEPTKLRGSGNPRSPWLGAGAMREKTALMKI